MIYTTLRQISVRIVSFIFLAGLLFFAGYVGYPVRCNVLACPPAAWSTIYEIVQTQAAKAGPTYRTGSIIAEPSFKTDFTTDGPSTIALRVTYISTEADIQEGGLYPEQMIEFSDRDPSIRWQNGKQWSGQLPSLQDQQRIARIRVSPREVYRATWGPAQRELSHSVRLDAASMLLLTDDSVQERFGVESAWAVSYYNDLKYITYWIDAQTGRIVQQTNEEIHKS